MATPAPSFMLIFPPRLCKIVQSQKASGVCTTHRFKKSYMNRIPSERTTHWSGPLEVAVGPPLGRLKRAFTIVRVFEFVCLCALLTVSLNCAHSSVPEGHRFSEPYSTDTKVAKSGPRASKQDGPGPVVPFDQLLSRGAKLTIADAVDIALRNNPATRAAWADARAAAAEYRSSRGAWLPTVNLTGSVTRSKSGPSEGGSGGPATNYNATASLSYLLLDFGGRSAAVEESHQAFLAEEWTSNAVMQNTVLQVEVAFFSYAGAKAMLEANMTSLAEAQANLAAAEERQRVGLATTADVLQARTAYSETKLAVLSSEGNVRTARASLAVSMGYPANISQELEVSAPEVPDARLSATVDELIDRALSGRPDLQAARVASLESRARVGQAWSRMLPSLSVSGYAGRTWPRGESDFSESYSGALQVQIPLFTGFSQQFDVSKAGAQAEAEEERARSVEQTVIFQVFSAHSDFLTAGERLKTTDDLVASAQQSEEVALGRYREGVGSILDLLSAQRALAMARAEQVNARLSWFIALTQLAHDVGVLGLDGSNPLVPDAFVPR